jgi:hypothetical protein
VSEAKNDPRLSIEERYLSHKDNNNKVKAAVNNKITGGFLLQEHADGIIEEQPEKIVSPPVPTETFPLWKMRGKPGK